MKLPKKIRNHARCHDIEQVLGRHRLQLWKGSEVEVCSCDLSEQLIAGLLKCKGTKSLVVGMDKAKQALSGAERDVSYSHLLLLANGGSERLYRGAVGLMRKHAVLCIRLNCDPEELGQALFQKEKQIKAILVEGFDPVSDVLFSLV
mgnify:CR=1 FL=1